MLTREQFLSGPKPTLEEVQCPALGGSVFVRGLSVGELDAFEAESTDADRRHLRARIAVVSVCDQDGKPLLTKQDVPALSTLAAHALAPIVDASTRLNKLSEEAVEDLAKN